MYGKFEKETAQQIRIDLQLGDLIYFYSDEINAVYNEKKMYFLIK